MTKRIGYFVPVLAAVLALQGPRAHAQTTGTTVDGFAYSSSDGQVTITGYAGAGGAITVPSLISGDPVTVIAQYAFAEHADLTGIVLPNSLTTIAELAFTGCSGLTSISIPANVTSIGGAGSVISPFLQCSSLASIGVDPGNPNYSSDGIAVLDKPQTQLFIVPGGISGSYTIPSSVGIIWGGAFSGCAKLTSVSIPANVSQIENGLPFSSCPSLASITVASGNAAFSSDGVALFNHSQTQLLEYPQGARGSYVVPGSVTSIEASAFSGCTGLATVTIPNSVTGIGDSAFAGAGLTSISIPSSVTSIGFGVFNGCVTLTSIGVDPSNPNYSGDGTALFNKAKTQLIDYPSGKVGSYTIPSTVTSLATFALVEAQFLTGITYPAGVTTIETSDFFQCTNLTMIGMDPGNPDFSSDGIALFNKGKTELLVFPPGRIGSYVIPDGVTSIGEYAFSGCVGLTSITLPASLTLIENGSFEDVGISSVMIPAGVTAIAADAFLNCASLTSIVFLGNAPTTDPTAFQGANSSVSITYPAGATGWTNPFAGIPASPSSQSPTPTPTPTPSPTPTPPLLTSRLSNISTRAQVGTGGNILIPGFEISGSGLETLLIRADGPALSQYGVSGVLAQPTLSLFDKSGNMIATNTGWGNSANPAQIAATAAAVGAFALLPGSEDCALVVSLPPGAYTAQVSGVNNTTGVALAEIYEVTSTGTRLINISVRAQVGTGANIIIPGFFVSGNGSEQLLVRGVGPGLETYGVAGVLAQPSITLFNSSGTAISSNTVWGTSSDPSQIASDDAQVGAFALQTGSADSALLFTFAPGAYTLQVTGVGHSTGDALAEAYEVP
jgi:BspA type Leucine rich repeat region (6 copies)